MASGGGRRDDIFIDTPGRFIGFMQEGPRGQLQRRLPEMKVRTQRYARKRTTRLPSIIAPLEGYPKQTCRAANGGLFHDQVDNQLRRWGIFVEDDVTTVAPQGTETPISRQIGRAHV